MNIKKNKYTLLELLVVLVISLILLAISAPAFLSMSKGQSVDIAGRNFGSELLAARNYAITHRQAVALILPMDQAGISSEYLYKSYCPCIVSDIDQNPCTFVEWIEGEKLEFLPTGTAILEMTNEITVNGVDFAKVGITTNSTSAKAIVFNERGTPVPNTDNTISIGDAAFHEASVSSVDNQIEIVVKQFTGRVTYESE